MSELRVALVAEGPTDRVVIEAALKAVLPRPFTLTMLQPEATRPLLGTGWCGVFKWCREFAARAHPNLESDPTLPGFDLFVIHLDADVADSAYADCGAAVELPAVDLPPLPCSRPCPPPADAVDQLRLRMPAWLGMDQVGPKTVFCVPSKATEAWLAAAVLDAAHPLLQGVECKATVAAGLLALPKAQRIRKSTRTYQQHAATVTRRWAAVSARCTQAERFGREVAATVSSTSGV